MKCSLALAAFVAVIVGTFATFGGQWEKEAEWSPKKSGSVNAKWAGKSEDKEWQWKANDGQGKIGFKSGSENGGWLKSKAGGGWDKSNSGAAWDKSDSQGGWFKSNPGGGWDKSDSQGGWFKSKAGGGWEKPNPKGGWEKPNPGGGWQKPNPGGGWPKSNPGGGWANSGGGWKKSDIEGGYDRQESSGGLLSGLLGGGGGKHGGGGLLSGLLGGGGKHGGGGLLSGLLGGGGKHGGGGLLSGLLGGGGKHGGGGLLSGLLGKDGLLQGLVGGLLDALLGPYGLLTQLLGGPKCNLLVGILGDNSLLSAVAELLDVTLEGVDDVLKELLVEGDLKGALNKLARSVDEITNEVDQVVDKTTDVLEYNLNIDLNDLDPVVRQLTSSIDQFVYCLIDVLKDLLFGLCLNGIFYADVDDLIVDLSAQTNLLKALNGLVGNIGLTVTGGFECLQSATASLEAGLVVLVKDGLTRFTPVLDHVFTKADISAVLEAEISADVLYIVDGSAYGGVTSVQAQFAAALELSASLTYGRTSVNFGIGIIAEVDDDVCDFTYLQDRITLAVNAYGSVRYHRKSPARALADAFLFAKARFERRSRVQRRLILNVCDYEGTPEEISVAVSLATELRTRYGCEIVIVQHGAAGVSLSLDGFLHICASVVTRGFAAVYRVSAYVNIRVICDEILTLTLSTVNIALEFTGDVLERLVCTDIRGYELQNYGSYCTDVVHEYGKK